MIGVRILLGMFLVLSAAASFSHAAIPRESIGVEFRDTRFDSTVARHTVVYENGAAAWLIFPEGELTTLRYELAFGVDFWQSTRRLRICSDASIAESIDIVSRRQGLVRILLEVPGQTVFSNVVTAIERLKTLAAANAVEGCKVEIIAFPEARHAPPDRAGRRTSSQLQQRRDHNGRHQRRVSR